MGKIIIEPYLLALQENSVVIAWEVNQNSNYSLKYKKIGAKTYKTAKLQQLCIDNGNSNILYFAQLIKLEINNMYQYNIYEGKTIIHKNTFSTAKNSEKLKILAYQSGKVKLPKVAVVQRICATPLRDDNGGGHIVV